MRAMHNYHSRARATWGNLLLSATKDLEDAAMSSLLKSTVLSLGVLAGTAAVALAQSVSALPPSSPATAPTAFNALKFRHLCKPTSGSIPIRLRSARSQDRTPRAKTSIIRRPMATMTRAAIHTRPLLVLDQTSNHAARPRQLSLFETRRLGRRVFCVSTDWRDRQKSRESRADPSSRHPPKRGSRACSARAVVTTIAFAGLPPRGHAKIDRTDLRALRAVVLSAGFAVQAGRQLELDAAVRSGADWTGWTPAA